MRTAFLRCSAPFFQPVKLSHAVTGLCSGSHTFLRAALSASGSRLSTSSGMSDFCEPADHAYGTGVRSVSSEESKRGQRGLTADGQRSATGEVGVRSKAGEAECSTTVVHIHETLHPYEPLIPTPNADRASLSCEAGNNCPGDWVDQGRGKASPCSASRLALIPKPSSAASCALSAVTLLCSRRTCPRATGILQFRPCVNTTKEPRVYIFLA